VGTDVTQQNGIARGIAAAGPLPYLSAVVHETFGKAEGDVILRMSIERIPHEPFTETDAIDSLRAVVRERHPEWAAEWMPEKT
jgi:hypothetical protein